MNDLDRTAELEQDNARLRAAIDKLEAESNAHYENYKAAKERLKALGRYLDLVGNALSQTPFPVWQRNAITDAVDYLESGAKSRIRGLWDEHPNDTFREAWAILQYWDYDLDEDPDGLKSLKFKYSPKKP